MNGIFHRFLAFTCFGYFLMLKCGAYDINSRNIEENKVSLQNENCTTLHHEELDLLKELESLPNISVECASLPDLSPLGAVAHEATSLSDKQKDGLETQSEETQSDVKVIYIERLELTVLFVTINNLRCDIDNMNKEIKNESAKIISYLDYDPQEDHSSSTKTTSDEDSSHTDKGRLYGRKYLNLMKQLRKETTRRKKKEYLGIYEGDTLTATQLNPPIIGSQMPDEPPIIKKRVVPEIPIETEDIRRKMFNVKRKFDEQKLRKVVDYQKDVIKQLTHKQLELLKLLEDIEKRGKGAHAAIKSLRSKLELQKSKIKCLKDECKGLSSIIESQKGELHLARQKILSIQETLLKLSELLRKTCTKVKVTDSTAKANIRGKEQTSQEAVGQVSEPETKPIQAILKYDKHKCQKAIEQKSRQHDSDIAYPSYLPSVVTTVIKPITATVENVKGEKCQSEILHPRSFLSERHLTTKYILPKMPVSSLKVKLSKNKCESIITSSNEGKDANSIKCRDENGDIHIATQVNVEED